MNKKWRIAQAAAVLLDAVCAALSLRGKKRPLLVLLALHGLEWHFFGRRVGALAGLPKWESAAATLLLGFTWWLPKNEQTHEELEASTDQSRFTEKASGVTVKNI